MSVEPFKSDLANASNAGVEVSGTSSCLDLVSIRKGEKDDEEERDPDWNNFSMFDTEENQIDNEYVSKLDGLGPIILNTDGTMGRIPNWSEYTESEKAQAIRLISARNKKRKEILLQAHREKFDKLSAVAQLNK